MGISDRQAGMLFDNPDWSRALAKAGVKGPTKLPADPAAPKKKRERPEHEVEEQIKKFLHSRGWILTRNHVGTFLGAGRVVALLKAGKAIQLGDLGPLMVRIGEKGTADFKAERPLPGKGFASVQQFYYEVKAPGEKPKPHQMDWLRTRAQLGFSAAWFDSFGGDTPTSFHKWYVARFGE
jgi:hypothetical protein